MVAIRRAAALVLTCTFVIGPLAGAMPATARAADDNAPWTLPTRPTKCTAAKVAAGTVADCLLTGADAPDSNGWPSPPFPGVASTSGGSTTPTTTPSTSTTSTTSTTTTPTSTTTPASTTPTTPTTTSAPATTTTDPADDDPAPVIGASGLPGWTWSGWAYNGSTALADWESKFVTNASAIGRVKANQLRSLPEVLPLFEGFLRDITAGGYKINDAATYAFRCTSGTGKTCVGRSRSSLSNHSWGLALDMNTAANPERTYVGVDGASACATPIETDIPRWVVQTAEKWGLYWGGYGWSSGCGSPTDSRTSATRDVHHFEFRGTPTQALTIMAVNTGSGCLPTVDDAGNAVPRCLAPGDLPGTGWRVVVDTKAPKGATAALVNIAMTGATADGYVTADACGAVPAGPRATANGSTMKGQTIANLSVVPLDAAGRFCLYRSKPMHTVVDVQGFFAPTKVAGTAGSTFSLVAPQRLIDTRITSFCDTAGTCTERGPVPPSSELTVNAPAVPKDAVAVLANLAITEPAGPGYLTADTCSSLIPGPQTHANANFAAADTVSNLSVVPVLAGPTGAQFCTYATAATQSVVDLQGYFSPAPAASSPVTPPVTPPGAATAGTGLGLDVVPTQRLVDTRACWTDPGTAVQRCGLANDPGAIIRIPAPAGASAVLINLSLTEAKADGFATAQACSLVQGPAGQSNGNVAKGKTVGNLAVVGVDPDGTFCVRVSQSMHVIVDLQGTFSPTGALRYLPLAPVRRSDTRVTGG